MRLRDVIFTAHDVAWRGVDLRIGVTNVFDESSTYVHTVPGLPLIVAREGRTLFARIGWTR